jgi:DNA replication licensing factor MCM5
MYSHRIYSIGNYRLGNRFLYREKLLRMHRRCTMVNDSAGNDEEVLNARSVATAAQNANKAKLEIDISHVGEYDASLLGFLISQPALLLPALELGAADALKTILYDVRKAIAENATQNMEVAQDTANPENMDNPLPSDILEESLAGISIQILLKGNLKSTNLRSINSEHMNMLIKCPGIVISTSPVKNRAVRLKLRCSSCDHERTVFATDGPFGSVILPPKCPGSTQERECPRFPYAVVPDDSHFVDQQTLKLQESPERVPTGEMPRSVLMVVERSLVDVAPPGTRVSVFCIPTMFTSAASHKSGSVTKSVYLRVVGMTRDNDAHGQAVTFTPSEEEAFRMLARRTDVYDILSRSIAPTISGSYTVDIKKALTCQLFSGSQKRLPDGVRLRGDINVLLLGDPSMAKSQFLKFISKVAPIGIYTSGKGSSAAGLTASVVRNAKGEFYLEGGAMVLADGGIVCIDEFDKMRPADRVAIHEAMEQQTISVAKAGITTVLNSRSSVLAAANPVFGRYDDFKSASENIDLMTTILSRFDVIFLVRDVREEERDRMICQHVMGVHINSSGTANVEARFRAGADSIDSGFSYTAAAVGDSSSDRVGDDG